MHASQFPIKNLNHAYTKIRDDRDSPNGYDEKPFICTSISN